MPKLTERKVFPVPDPEGPEYRDQCRAMRNATWGAGVKIGGALGYRDGGRTVQHFGEPDRIVPSPVWDAYVLLSMVQRFQADEPAALEPIRWLCESLGGRFVRSTGDVSDCPSSADVMPALGEAAASFGEWLTAAAAGAADGQYSLRELEGILKEAREHLDCFYQIEERMKQIKRKLQEALP